MPDKHKMLDLIGEACKHCGICELGWTKAKREGLELDPHVPGWRDAMSRLPDIVVVGQNPGWNEVKVGIPFVGSSGRFFSQLLEEYGSLYYIDRGRFYITNAVKCYTRDNMTPSEEVQNKCEVFLKMELGIIKPKFVIALGAVAFSVFCPGVNFHDSMGKFTKSEKFGKKVFATYHPSPRNMEMPDREAKFRRDIKMLCELIGRLESPF